jgi:hypothetical protein
MSLENNKEKEIFLEEEDIEFDFSEENNNDLKKDDLKKETEIAFSKVVTEIASLENEKNSLKEKIEKFKEITQLEEINKSLNEIFSDNKVLKDLIKINLINSIDKHIEKIVDDLIDDKEYLKIMIENSFYDIKNNFEKKLNQLLEAKLQNFDNQLEEILKDELQNIKNELENKRENFIKTFLKKINFFKN